MPTQEAKAHHVGEWASLRNTSPVSYTHLTLPTKA